MGELSKAKIELDEDENADNELVRLHNWDPGCIELGMPKLFGSLMPRPSITCLGNERSGRGVPRRGCRGWREMARDKSDPEMRIFL